MINKTKRSIPWIFLKNKIIKKKEHTGVHLLVDFWFGKKIEDEQKIKKILQKAARVANNTPLKIITHKFSPQGITGVILLAESHIAIHTWPEKNYISIDLFTCGEKTRPHLALDYLVKTFNPKKIDIQEKQRGILNDKKVLRR